MSHWPLFGLRVRTPRLELRVGTDEDLQALADLAAEGVHDPQTMPFATPWTDAEPAARARATMQWQWRSRAVWAPEAWALELVVLADTPDGPTVVGTQGMVGKDFAVLREVGTGSWLGRRYHGQGIGTEMRAAVLHLAFVGLGAKYARSEAFDHNAASLGVSRKLGYRENGTELVAVRGQPETNVRLRLDRATWERQSRVDVRIEGLEPCLEMFGVPATPEPPASPGALPEPEHGDPWT